VRRLLAFVLVLALPLAAIAVGGADPAARLLIDLGFDDAAASIAHDPAVRGEALYAARRWVSAASAFRQGGADQSYNLANALSRAGQLDEAIKAYDVALDQNPDDEDAAFNRALVADLLKSLKMAGPIATTEGGANSAATMKRNSLATADDKGSGDPTGTGDGLASGEEVEAKKGSPGGSKVAMTGTHGGKTEEFGEGQAHGSAGDAEGAGRRGGALASATAQWQARERRTSNKSWEGQSVLPTRQWLDALADDPGKFLKLRLAAERARRLEAASLTGGAR
jgi:Ca-activated chloride channel family protein